MQSGNLPGLCPLRKQPLSCLHRPSSQDDVLGLRREQGLDCDGLTSVLMLPVSGLPGEVLTPDIFQSGRPSEESVSALNL